MDKPLGVRVASKSSKRGRVVRDVDRGVLVHRVHAHELEQERLPALVVADGARGDAGLSRGSRRRKRWEAIREPGLAEVLTDAEGFGAQESSGAAPRRRRVHDRIVRGLGTRHAHLRPALRRKYRAVHHGRCCVVVDVPKSIHGSSMGIADPRRRRIEGVRASSGAPRFAAA